MGVRHDRIISETERSLRDLVDAIVANDSARFSELLERATHLAKASFGQGATRQDGGNGYFFPTIGHYIYAGDTALHFAAAAYRYEMVDQLMQAGANSRAKNRRGAEPLHAAAFGSPEGTSWDPSAQAATIERLVKAVADPNAQNMDGATPLHIAVRTRCAGAVRALLAHGANPRIGNENGSTAMELALHNTGRSGSGSAEAKVQLQEILRILGS